MHSATDALEVGTVIGNGRFAVIGILGEGTQGRTYEAIDKTDGSVVALKEFSVHGAREWKDVELAEREATVLASLSYPSLPKYLAHFEERHCLYLAMERIRGATLQRLRDSRRFSKQDVVDFLRDAAATLDYLHGRAPPVIHRDIKPSNVIRNREGRFVLVDFGSVASVLKPDGGSTVTGTFGYMAPEQFQGRAMPATDVYAVGVTALTMLTGVDPDQLPHKGLAIDVEATLGSNAAAPLKRLLAAATNPDPDIRARQSLSQLVDAHGLTRGHGPASQNEKRANAGRGAPQATSHPDGSRERKARNRKDKRRRRREHRDRGRAWDQRSAWLWLQLPPVLFAALLGLWIARIATSAVMLVVVPVLLTSLSLVMGPGLRRGARESAAAGSRSRRALQRASRRVRELAESPNPWQEEARRDAERADDRHEPRSEDRGPSEQRDQTTRRSKEGRQRFRLEDLEEQVEEFEEELERAARRGLDRDR